MRLAAPSPKQSITEHERGRALIILINTLIMKLNNYRIIFKLILSHLAAPPGGSLRPPSGPRPPGWEPLHYTLYFHFALLRFPKNLAKQWFKTVDQKPMFIGWMCDSLNQSGHGGGTKRQQSFLFGSEELNALVSSDESMLSKCDDVITYATEPLNIQMRQLPCVPMCILSTLSALNSIENG